MYFLSIPEGRQQNSQHAGQQSFLKAEIDEEKYGAGEERQQMKTCD